MTIDLAKIAPSIPSIHKDHSLKVGRSRSSDYIKILTD